MARLRVSSVLLDDLLFPNREANIVGVAEVEPGCWSITFEIEGGDVPDCDEVLAVITEHRPVTVAFEPVKITKPAWPTTRSNKRARYRAAQRLHTCSECGGEPSCSCPVPLCPYNTDPNAH